MTSTFRDPWWQVPASFVGILIGIGLAVVSAAVAYSYPETAPTTFVLAVHLEVILWYLERSRRRHNLAPSLVRIGRTYSRIPDPWPRQVAEEIIDSTGKMLDGLAQPAKTYSGEEDFYNAMSKAVSELPPGSDVWAVCGDKTWDAESVQNYFNSNIKAVGCGVTILRVFYQLSGRVAEEAQRQADLGVSARMLTADKMEGLRPINQIPFDLGIAIFNERTVFLHRGLGAKARASRHDCPKLASAIRSQFAIVELLAEPVKPNLPVSPVADSSEQSAVGPRKVHGEAATMSFTNGYLA